MKLRLLRDTRPFGRTGEVVEASPDGSDFLLSLGLAEPVTEIRERIKAPEKQPELSKETEKAPAKAAAKTQQKAAKAAKKENGR